MTSKAEQNIQLRLHFAERLQLFVVKSDIVLLVYLQHN